MSIIIEQKNIKFTNLIWIFGNLRKLSKKYIYYHYHYSKPNYNKIFIKPITVIKFNELKL